MGQGLLDLIDQDQAEIARMQALKCHVDGLEFTGDGVDALGAPGVGQAVEQQADDLAVGAAALAGILVENHIVEGVPEDLGLLPDVLVAPVAGAADDDRAADRRHVVDGLDQRLDGVRVVAVVGDQRGTLVIEDVEAAGGGHRVADEVGQRAFDDRPLVAERPAGGGGSHGVIDLEADGAVAGQRHVGQRNALFLAAFAEDDRVSLDVNDPLALRPGGGQHAVVAVAGEEEDVARAVVGHGSDDRVGGVEDGRALGRDVLYDDALDDGQFVDGGDVVEAEVVADADVGDHGDIAHVEAEAFTQHAAAGGFEDGGVDVRVHQHVAGAARAGAVTGVDAPAFDVDAVGAGHADAQAVRFEDAADQPAGRRLAVGPGDGDDRDAGIVAIREHHADDGLADRAALAEGRVEVHAQAGGGIDFDDAAALVFERLVHGVADDVDAGDVKADRLRGGNGGGSQFGMDVVGDVGGGAAGGQGGVVAQHDADAAAGHGIGVVTLFGQAGQGDLIETELGQRGGVAVRAARVAVDDVDQLANGVRAVTDDQRRVAAGGGDQLVADDQQTPVVAGQEALGHDVVAEFDGDAVGLADLFFAGQVDRNALALVAVLRFDDDRQADFLGGGPGVVIVLDRAAVRDGNAGSV